MNWLKGIKELALGVYGSNYESIDQDFDDGRVSVSHVFLPIHNASYFAIISGSEETKAKVLNLLSEKFGRSPFNLHKSKGNWVAAWESGSNEVPKSDIARVIGGAQVDQICAKEKLSKKERKLVDIMLTFYSYFSELKPSYKDRVFGFYAKDLSPAEISKVRAAIHEIETRYIKHVDRLVTKPG